MTVIYATLQNNLISAISQNNLSFVKLVVHQLSDLEKAVQFASSLGYLDIVEFLVSRGADIRYDDDEAVRNASKNGHLETVAFLISKGASIDVALCSGVARLDVVKYLVSMGADVRANNDGALACASVDGNIEVVKYLISLGADAKADNNSSVLCASQFGHLDVVKFLVSQGADFRVDDDYCVRVASHWGHLDVVKYLVSLGADVRSNDYFAIDDYYYISAAPRASAENKIETIIYLVSRGFDVNCIKNEKINNLVMYCYDKGDFDCAFKLSQHKHFSNETIKKSLAKIHRGRNFMNVFFNGNNYVDIIILH